MGPCISTTRTLHTNATTLPPCRHNNNTLVIDLHDTLIHETEHAIVQRHGLKHFLNTTHAHFEIVLYVNKHKHNTHAILQQLHIQQHWISHITHENDLTKLGRSLATTLRIRNHTQPTLQRNHTLRITPFHGQRDSELLHLTRTLTRIAQSPHHHITDALQSVMLKKS